MVWYGLATLFVYALNTWASRDNPKLVDAWGVSLMLCVTYALSNIVVGLFGWPETIVWFPFIDALFATMLFYNWRKDRRAWKVVVMSAVAFQGAAHVVAIAMWKAGVLTGGSLYIYAVIMNGAYIVQLLANGGVGLAHALSRLRAWRTDLLHRASHADARR